jgi:hypothetical protein
LRRASMTIGMTVRLFAAFVLVTDGCPPFSLAP